MVLAANVTCLGLNAVHGVGSVSDAVAIIGGSIVLHSPFEAFCCYHLTRYIKENQRGVRGVSGVRERERYSTVEKGITCDMSACISVTVTRIPVVM